MHDRLFMKPSQLDTAALLQDATTLGVATDRFSDCLHSGETDSELTRDMAEARKYAVSVTPFFFVGRILADGRLQAEAVLPGTGTLSEFRALIDRMDKPLGR
jgi:protein-disulfide isomerase